MCSENLVVKELNKSPVNMVKSSGSGLLRLLQVQSRFNFLTNFRECYGSNVCVPSTTVWL